MNYDLPHGWDPRPYQLPLWEYLQAGGKRAMAMWHRRAGKDDVCLHWTACAAALRVGTYWHMLPEAAQARKAIWDAVNPHTGKRRVDEAFPPAIRETTREHEMFIRFKNGSAWQVVGSDNYDSLVGSPPIGVVFSEWALADPMAWAYIRPILRENGGWALFITTPRGRNHATTMMAMAQAEEEWFAQKLAASDTGVFTAEDLEKELREYEWQFGPEIGRTRFEQEYNCSEEAGMVGAFYARLIQQAEDEGRITGVPYDPKAPVYTAWDLGFGDETAIWWVQTVGKELRWLDYYEASGVGLDHFAAQIRSRPWGYDEHLLPHDGDAGQLGTGKSIAEVLTTMLGGKHGRVRSVPRLPGGGDVDAGINALRMLLPRSWFDAKRCARGIEALRTYRAEWDETQAGAEPQAGARLVEPLRGRGAHVCDGLQGSAEERPDQLPQAREHRLMASQRQQNEINELRRRLEALEALVLVNNHDLADRRRAALERAREAKAAKREQANAN
jgi:phage terminase large subunit